MVEITADSPKETIYNADTAPKDTIMQRLHSNNLSLVVFPSHGEDNKCVCFYATGTMAVRDVGIVRGEDLIIAKNPVIKGK